MSEIELANDDNGLLNFAVVIAENWILIVIVPLVAGILAYVGLTLSATPQYRSEAVLQLDASDAAMLSSIQALTGAVIAEHADSVSAKSQALSGHLSVARIDDAELYRLTLVTDAAPQQAQRYLQAIIDAAIQNSIPSDSQRQQLEARQQQVEFSLAELQDSLRRLNQLADRSLQTSGASSGMTPGDFGTSTVSILRSIEKRQSDLLNIQTSINGSISENDIVQLPTLPSVPQPTGSLNRVLFIVVAAALLMLVLGFVRDGFRRASADPRALDSVNRVRRAFWLKPKSS